MIKGKCLLCLNKADLLDSHYLPKRLYSMNRATSLKNPNPITLSKGVAKQSSLQLRDHAYCANCENLFNVNGEQWVLKRLAKDYGQDCELQEILISNSPAICGKDINVYEGNQFSTLEIDKLIYFGMSIFWRGASKTWKMTDGALAPRVDLGIYYEPIRKYLLGDKFPDNIYIITLIDNRKPVPNALTPVIEFRDLQEKFYWFYANGLGYKLYCGSDTKQSTKKLCSFHGTNQPIVIDRNFGSLLTNFLRDKLIHHSKSDSVNKLI